MEIVRATQADQDFVLDHSVEAMLEGTRGTFDAEKQQERARELISSLFDRGVDLLVAKEDDSIIGWVVGGSNKDYFSGKEIGFLYDLHVFSEHRGRGIGKELMQRAIADLKAAGYDEIRLNVFAGNPAQKMYENLGFQVYSSQMVLK
ncbi:GNAT family N-acetyltransferase [Tumebacillus lipolyticus]|uniref:GNAT family N-acetyltransferase n=1 Tax=Tumebacillus lipolyticus TaxID=1280370 RepID=A0ABW4ZUN8_9BACL